MKNAALEINFKKGAFFIGIIYLILYAFFLFKTNGLPYVMDNNESFSALNHAENMYQFGVNRSFGLTDEGASPSNPQAHPFIHTHQGNFPRLFAFLLYALGARTVEAQIIITTFTIGLATLLLAYYFFSKITSPLFSAITCLVMMSDYILFSQWQVNTYRIWYGFFFFSTLCYLHGIQGKHKNLFSFLLGLNFLCIFYWEFVYASFLWALSLFYAFFLYRRQWKTIGKIFLIQSLTGVFALVILFSQLTFYMGFENVLKDIYYTISARNFINNSEQFTKVQKFYENTNIVFLLNFMQSFRIKTLDWFLSSFFKYIFIVYTPYFILISGLSVCGWIINTIFHRLHWDEKWQTLTSLSLDKPHLNQSWNELQVAIEPLALLFKILLLMSGCFILFNAAWIDLSLFGVIRNPLQTFVFWKKPFVFFISAVISFVVISILSRVSNSPKNWSFLRVFIAWIGLLTVTYIIRIQGYFYAQEFSPIWGKMITPLLALFIYPALPVGVGIFLMLILNGQQKFFQDVQKSFAPLWPFLLCVVLATGVAWFWAAGYLFSGYLNRWCPFSSFAFYTLIALAIYTPYIFLIYLKEISGFHIPHLFSLCSSLFKHVFMDASDSKDSHQSLMAWASFFIAATIGFFVLYWINLQALYVKYLPPTYGLFMKKLREPPFKNSSFITNNYGASIANLTRSWAYMIPDALTSSFLNPDEGLSALKEAKICQWFADRHQNSQYDRPRYYLRYAFQNHLDAVSRRISREADPASQNSAKADLGEFINDVAQNQKFEKFPFRIIAQDQSRWNLWTIVELNWPIHPYLAPMDKSQAHADVVRKFILPLPSQKSSEAPEEEAKFILFKLDSSNPSQKEVLPLWIHNGLFNEKTKEWKTSLFLNIHGMWWHHFTPTEPCFVMNAHPTPSPRQMSLLMGDKIYSFDFSNTTPEETPLPFNCKKNELLFKKETNVEIAAEDSLSSTVKGYFINYSISKKGHATQMMPAYAYQHPDKKPEKNSILTLYKVSVDGWEKLATNDRQEEFTLPKEFKNDICISVIPKCEDGEGIEYFGPVIRLPQTND